MRNLNFPMQGATATQPTISILLNKPDWIGTPTLEKIMADTSYTQTLADLFAVEITVQPALTKKQSGGKASSKRRSKKGGKEQQQKKKPAPKAKPQQQNAKVNQPKKEQAQKKKGEVAKGKKGKK